MSAEVPRSSPHLSAVANSALAKLDERSREIFRQIVESYLATGEPVGSRNLSKILPMTLSPASVRNVMQDLEEAGLIYAPHTSAGRLPTETGLRFFVDALMQFGDLAADERNAIEAQVAASARDHSFESVLADATQLLSGMSRGAGVVLTSKSNVRLKHIEFVRIEPERALVVLVSPIPAGLPPSALVEASNFLNAHIRGRTLAEARTEMQKSLEQAHSELDGLTQKLVEAGLASWSGGEPSDRKLIVRGQANLLGDLKAMEDLERIRLLFDDLEYKLFSLSGSSMVVAPYRDGERRIVGVLGVIGPTRLNYARIVPMVDYTAKVLSRLIT
ncbi:MAG: heat-inducible transcriptional repressor [Xanthobacteraceae bacterium]|nr:MAG: heat-inducible transcriptional repressor [Xanthobacteraceae bacterium]